MSLANNYAPDKTVGNGVTTVFTGNWDVIAEAYGVVALENVSTGVRVIQTLGVDYSLTFTTSGYTVTFLITPPPATEYVVISRDTSIDQAIPFRTSKGFQGANIEGSLDKITAQNQDQQDAIGRAITLQIGTSTTGLIFPEPVAETVVSFNAAGDQLEATVTVTEINNAAANAALTAADVVLTNADVVLTNADVVLTNADVVLTGLDVASTNADAVSTAADAVSTAADAVSTAADVISAAASVEAIGFKWEFDNTTAMADPTTTKFRMNNATPSSVSAIAIADTTADTGTPDVSAYVLAWDDSTSTANRGYLELKEIANPEKFAIFKINGASVDNVGWVQLAVSYVTGNSTFTNTNDVMVRFSATGDTSAAAGLGGAWADWKQQYDKEYGSVGGNVYAQGFGSYFDSVKIGTELYATIARNSNTSSRRYVDMYSENAQGNVQFGEKVGSTDALHGCTIAKASTDKYIAVFGEGTGTNIKAICGTVAFTSSWIATEGSYVTLNATNTSYGLKAVNIDTDKVLTAYQTLTSQTIEAVLMTASGTVITAGTPVVMSSGAIPNYYGIGLCKMTTSRAVVAYRNSSNKTSVALMGLSGTTITDLGELEVDSSAVQQRNQVCGRIDDNTVLVVYADHNTNYSLNYIIVDITSDVISVTASGTISTNTSQGNIQMELVDLGTGVFSLLAVGGGSSWQHHILTCTTSTLTLNTGGAVAPFMGVNGALVVASCYDSDNDEVAMFNVSTDSTQIGIALRKLRKELT